MRAREHFAAMATAITPTHVWPSSPIYVLTDRDAFVFIERGGHQVVDPTAADAAIELAVSPGQGSVGVPEGA